MNKQWIWIAALSLFLAACGSDTNEPAPGTSEGATAIPDGFGKSDNYIATNAMEFILEGTATATLPEGFDEMSEEEQEVALDELLADRTSTITNAARRHVEDLLREPNQDIEDEEAKFFIYVKPSYQGGEALGAILFDGSVEWNFQLELVGSFELIEMIGENFQLEVDEQAIDITVMPSPSTDSFPDYSKLFEDGIYDIAIIFGGDYNEGRYDLETAGWTVEYLLQNGWTHDSVDTFDDLTHESGPFRQTLYVEGGSLEARVYIVHSNMDDDAGEEQSLLRELVEGHIAERDVVIYSGHAGTNAGMILDYQPRYEIDDDEFADLEMPDKYQVWVFDGCNSYRTYVDKLMLNESRTFDNTTAVTTVNTTPFSAGYEIINRFVHWFTFAGQDGAHFPISWNTLLRGINDEFPTVHYGVHGIDQDPKLNPHTGGVNQCLPCSSDADCGAGGNYCLGYTDGSACGVGCTSDDACGAGFDCIDVTDDPDQFYVPRQCVAKSLTCE